MEIYCDGSCQGNGTANAEGGFGVVVVDNGEVVNTYAEMHRQTTNNRMELRAVIEAVRALKVSCKIAIHTDSAYVCNAFHQNWLNNWQANGWKTSSKRDVENQDLWRELLDVLSAHTYTFVKVKGHSDNPFNNRCDELARLAIKQAIASQTM